MDVLTCPKGCQKNGVSQTFESIRGLKRHMTMKHSGWKGELDSLFGTAERDPEQGRAEFLAEADQGVPVEINQDGSLREKATVTPIDEPQKTVEIKTDAISRKFSGKLNKLKKRIADKLPEAVSIAVKDSGPEWALTPEDTELLSEAVEDCFDILDIEFKVSPISKTITNPIWVLLLPILALVLVFVPKGMRHAQNVRLDQEREASTSGKEPSPESTDRIQ